MLQLPQMQEAVEIFQARRFPSLDDGAAALAEIFVRASQHSADVCEILDAGGFKFQEDQPRQIQHWLAAFVAARFAQS